MFTVKVTFLSPFIRVLVGVPLYFPLLLFLLVVLVVLLDISSRMGVLKQCLIRIIEVYIWKL